MQDLEVTTYQHPNRLGSANPSAAMLDTLVVTTISGNILPQMPLDRYEQEL